MADDQLSGLKIDKDVYAGKSRRKRAVYLVVVFFVLAVLAVLYVSGIVTSQIEIETALVGKAFPSQGFTLLNASGYVVAQRKAAVASKVTGRIISVSVEEGTLVKKGDVVARLENDDAAAAKQQAAALLEVARADLAGSQAEIRESILDLERKKELFAGELIPKAGFDSADARYQKADAAAAGAEAAVRAATAALRAAEIALEYTYIRAPFDAVVLTKNADVGDIVTPIGAAAEAKAAVVTIADMSSLQVEVDVSESNLGQVSVGQPCEIQLDAFPDSRLRGEVHMIVPTADRTRATVMVKVRFLDNDSRILPEMSAKVAFLERQLSSDEREPRTAIHPDSIVTRNGKQYVFLVAGDRVAETGITAGGRIGDMVEVISGIKAGDKIVASPPARLRDGARIKIADK